ncbi:LysM peptidoglycan-binding domain-containing protein [Carnobacterium sp.]|uniref:LysM peptidoglycan-binding domain-containing protein n=1 Tax=Carnobacterium sp. TaxID=48221 RepID=UPI00388E1307
MEKTRKERISAVKNQKSFVQSENANGLIKKGTAVFSTTLLVSLLAFPTFSASASANELAETSSKKLEETIGQNDTASEEGQKEAIEADNSDYIPEDATEKQQLINELKSVLSPEDFEPLSFDELSIEEIDELLTIAIEKAELNKETETSTSFEPIDESNDPDSEETENLTNDTLEKDNSEELDESEVAVPEKETVNEQAEDTAAVVIEEPEIEVVDNNDEANSEPIESEIIEEQTTSEDEVTEDKVTEDKVTEPVTKPVTEPAKEESIVEKAKVVTPKVATTSAKIADTTSPKKLATTATTATTVATTAVEKAKTYTVKSGDTLNKISRANNVTVAQLKKWNKLSTDLIKIGQVLALNETASKSTPTATPTNTNNAIADASTPAGFVNAITSYAKQVAADNNLYASVMIAQAALESGYGTSKLSTSPNYNLFGIKGSYNGNTVTMYTSEWSSSTGWIYIPQNFKKYPSYAESLQDNANLLKRGTSWDNGYYSGAWASNSNSAYEATAWLQGRYATDPSYASKLNAIIKTYNLTQYDTKSSGETAPTTPSTPVSNDNNNVSTPDAGNTSSTSYKVKSGDTLTAIASKYGVSVSNLKSWNSLKSDMIYVNQTLSIKGGSTSGGTTTPAPSTGNTSSTSYTVKSGDTLTGISSKYGLTVSNLKSWNNLKSDTIYVNQALTIKGGSTSGGGTTTPAPSTGNTSSTSYKVKSGDTLTAIASKYGVSVSNLKSWNNLKSDTIYVNQALTIKGGSTSGGTTTPAPSTGNTSSTSYTVKSGDTLTGISSKYGVTVSNLKTWNKLSTDAISIGQTLVVKNVTASSSVQITKPTTSRTHKVVSGDTLWDIAQKYGMSISEIKTANYLKSDVIFVDQTLIIK